MTGITDDNPAAASIDNEVRERIAADLLVFAALHERPLDRDVIVALWSHCYEGLLALNTPSAGLRQALGTFCQCLTDIPSYADPETEAALLDDYQRVHGVRNGDPCPNDAGGSGPRPIDQLFERNQPKRWLEKYRQEARVCAADRNTSLSLQLRQLAARLLLAEAAMAHPENRDLPLPSGTLERIQGFLADIAVRSHTPLYAALARLTSAYVEELPASLCETKGEHRSRRNLPAFTSGMHGAHGQGATARRSPH